jgi:hypothetical protein
MDDANLKGGSLDPPLIWKLGILDPLPPSNRCHDFIFIGGRV